MVCDAQKKRLQTLTVEAVDSLVTDIGGVLGHLITNSVLTENMRMDIESNRNKMAQARELHMMVMRLGPGAYEGYYKSLMSCGMSHVATQMEDLLNPQFGRPCPREMAVVHDHQPMPDVGPPAEYELLNIKMRMCDLNDLRTQESIRDSTGTLTWYIMVCDAQKKRLQTLTVEAVDSLVTDIGGVLGHLITNSVLTENMRMDIESNRNKMAQARELHMMVMQLGPGAYEGYYKSLMSCGMSHVATQMEDLLNPQFGRPCPREMAVVHDHQPMPDVWPPAEYELLNIKMRMCDLNDLRTQESIRDSTGTLVYPLPHGHALIINNYTFNNVQTHNGETLKNRPGTDRDSAHMRNTFEEIGFEVDCVNDCDAKAILTEVERSARKDLSKKCFVCVILSHGLEGSVYGVDGKTVPITQITTASKHLRGSPRVFIIQACQGQKKDKGEKGIQNSETGHEDMKTNSEETHVNDLCGAKGDGTGENEFVSFNFEPENDHHLDNLRSMEKEMSNLSVESTDGPGAASIHGDIFIAMSTVEGYVSWRNTRGTWFIQALVYVLKNWAYCDDIDGIFTRVTNLVSRQKHQKHPLMQVAMKKSTLYKKLFFLPGIDEDAVERMRRNYPRSY